MLLKTANALMDLIRGRRVSYARVFDPANQFTKPVLNDLARFCRAHDTTFHQDPRIHAMLEGRREVWLRISQYLNLTEQELFDLHAIREVEKK